MRLSLLVLFLMSLFCSPLRAQEEIEPPAEPFDEKAVTEEEVSTPDAAPQEMADDSDATAAETLVATLKARFCAVAELLAQVQDAETAQALQGEVSECFAALLQTDASALETADEEELAAEFAEAFAPVDAELARLEEENFYGVEALRAVFADGEEAADADEAGYCFPLGPLDFLRGGGEKHQVCPRRESGLQLLDWDEE